MAGDVSAASATEQGSSYGVVKTILLVSLGVFFAAWIYESIRPPPVKTFAITSPRIKLRDGRHLAYKEHGVSRDKAKFKIVYIHGFDSSRHDAYFAYSISPVGYIYIFDRFYKNFIEIERMLRYIQYIM